MKQTTARNILICAAVLGATVSGLVLMKAFKSPPEAKSTAEKEWHVAAVPVLVGDRIPNLTLYGYVQSPQTATLKAAVVGDVASVGVLDGALVEQGDLLLSLDDRPLRLRVDQAQADVNDAQGQLDALELKHQSDQKAYEHDKTLLALAEQQMARAKNLFERKLSSQSNYDTAIQTYEQQSLTLNSRELALKDYPARRQQAQARVARAQAALEQARLDLSYTQVRAPFTGRVSAVQVSVGDRVQVGSVLLTLFDVMNAEVIAQIPNEYVPLANRVLLQGEPIKGVARADGEVYPIAFDRLSGAVNRGRGGVDGFFKILNGAESLPLGRFVEATIDLPAIPHAIEVPASAVFRGERVYRIKDGRLQRLAVTRLGQQIRSGGEQWLILGAEGIEDGDLIMTTPLPNAINGLKVDVKPTEQ